MHAASRWCRWKVFANMTTVMFIGVFRDTGIYMKHCKQLGYEVIATHPLDIKEKYYYHTVKDYIDHFYHVGYMNLKSLIKIARGHKVNYLIPHSCSQDASYAMGYINSALNLPGIHHEVSNHIANKMNWHLFLKDNGLPGTKWCVKADDVEDFSKLGYPCIAKPNMGAGSQGVRIFKYPEECEKFFREKNVLDGYGPLKRYDFYIIQEFINARYYMGYDAIRYSNTIDTNQTAYILARTKDLNKVDLYPFPGVLTTVPSQYYNGIIRKSILTPEIINVTNFIFEKLDIKDSILSIQMLLDENYKLLNIIEINPRATMMSWFDRSYETILGFNYVEHIVKFASGRNDYDFNISKKVHLDYPVTSHLSLVLPNSAKNQKIKKVILPENQHDIMTQHIKPVPSVVPSVVNVNASYGFSIVFGESFEDCQQKFTKLHNRIIIK